MNFLMTVLMTLYSVVITLMLPAVRLIAVFNPRLKNQIKERGGLATLSKRYGAARAKMAHSVVFFCSSAGEYEQAKPLISRFSARGDIYIQIVFFSRSGYDYAEARGETTPYCLSPLDTIWHWGWLFSALRPDITVVVRHELWPGFLATAKNYGKLFMIDGSRSVGEVNSAFKRAARKWLLRYFDMAWLVSVEDLEFFTKKLGLSEQKAMVIGDTKYDRVRERALSNPELIKEIGSLLDGGEAKKRLVIGSAYRDEVSLALRAMDNLEGKLSDWQLLIAPHDISREMIDWISAQCEAHSWIKYSDLESGKSEQGTTYRIVIMDKIGILAETYGCSSIAIVGGALYAKIHNILEPACHGLALAHGPLYKNSQEAERLVSAGLSKVIVGSDDLTEWWSDHLGGERSEKLLSAINEMCGAADYIVNELKKHL